MIVDRGIKTMTNEELLRNREQNWNGFTRFMTVGTVLVCGLLAMMALTLV